MDVVVFIPGIFGSSLATPDSDELLLSQVVE